MGWKILIMDDDANLIRVLETSLVQDGYELLTATEAEEGLRLIREEQPDLVLLDVMMPSVNGFEVCDRVRQFSDVPIIFLTGRTHEQDIVRGLNCGADDYLLKPFSLAELRMRVEATLRRTRLRGLSDPLVFNDGVLYIDANRSLIKKREQAIVLSPKEFQVLACLLRHVGQVVPHEQLLQEVWGPRYTRETSYLALHISYLRAKIEDNPKKPHYICTRHRVGYYFDHTGANPAHPAP